MDKTHSQYLLGFVKKYTTLSENDAKALLEIFRQRAFANKEYILDPDNQKSRIFFICSGLVRYYCMEEDGNEWNKSFISENMITTAFSADFLGQTSPYGMQAIEDTTLLVADHSDFASLYDAHPKIERLGRKLLELALINKMNRERSFLINSAKTRYQEFVLQNPQLALRIPKYHLASYLGITESSLSRLSK
ncbi:hypothetical protein A9R01_11100 ['Osedax' symbiont bacterium Rs2_46_30_T18]|nr:hypothetical protein A9R01_11100 ['Osedax' symbiont bacterium Rs2_46_30_T18]